jgi:signal recognition particle GTPase
MAIAAAGMFMDWKAGQDAKDKARALRREQLIMHDMTAAENRRRTIMTQRQQTGAARAAAYASGTQYGGSTASYVDEMVSQFKHDLNWQDMTADQERKVIRRGGSAVTSGITAQSTGNLLAGGMGLLDRVTSLG